MRCVLTPVVGPVLAFFTQLVVLKAVLKDANVTPALFLMATNVFPWTSVGVCSLADI